MAKKIRFPLKMKNGTEVRTLDELKENFDLESVLGYFTDGRLVTWLSDRYYDEKAEAVSALSADMPDLNAKLCEILEVEYQGDDDVSDIEYIQRHNEKLHILSSVTANRDILDNVDIVAISQDDLYDILDESPSEVYLYGEKFYIPFSKKNICYIGVNEPVVSIDRNKYVYEYNESGITFRSVRYEEGVNSNITRGEMLFTSGNYIDAFPYVESAATSGNPKAMYLMGLYCYWGYNTVIIDLQKRNYWFEQGYRNNDPLAAYWYAKWCVADNSDDQTRIYRSIFSRVKQMADSGDNFAQHTLGSMYDYGRGTEADKNKATEYYKLSAYQGNAFAQNNYSFCVDDAEKIKWIKKSAEQGCALAQYNLGDRYYGGKGTAQNYGEAFKWYQKAAEQGYASGQRALGFMYEYGYGTSRDHNKAFECYMKAAEQGYATAQNDVGLMYSHGTGVDKSESKAIEWFKKAAANGDSNAKSNLKNRGIYTW